MAEENKKVIESIIRTDTVLGSTFSQIARVTVTDSEITIEFAYIHPINLSQGQTVARVTMPRSSGHQLAESILQIENLHEKRKEGKKDD